MTTRLQDAVLNEWPDGVPTPRAAEMRVDVADLAEVAALVASSADSLDGWVCLPSEVLMVQGGRWTEVREGSPVSAPGAEELAAVLSGELSVSPTTSIHLRRGGGGPAAWKYIEGDGGEPVFVIDEEFVSTQKGLRLAYHTAWRRNPPVGSPAVQTWSPWLSRFAGWRRSS